MHGNGPSSRTGRAAEFYQAYFDGDELPLGTHGRQLNTHELIERGYNIAPAAGIAASDQLLDVPSAHGASKQRKNKDKKGSTGDYLALPVDGRLDPDHGDFTSSSSRSASGHLPEAAFAGSGKSPSYQQGNGDDVRYDQMPEDESPFANDETEFAGILKAAIPNGIKFQLLIKSLKPEVLDKLPPYQRKDIAIFILSFASQAFNGFWTYFKAADNSLSRKIMFHQNVAISASIFYNTYLGTYFSQIVIDNFLRLFTTSRFFKQLSSRSYTSAEWTSATFYSVIASVLATASAAIYMVLARDNPPFDYSWAPSIAYPLLLPNALLNYPSSKTLVDDCRELVRSYQIDFYGVTSSAACLANRRNAYYMHMAHEQVASEIKQYLKDANRVLGHVLYRIRDVLGNAPITQSGGKAYLQTGGVDDPVKIANAEALRNGLHDLIHVLKARFDLDPKEFNLLDKDAVLILALYFRILNDAIKLSHVAELTPAQKSKIDTASKYIQIVLNGSGALSFLGYLASTYQFNKLLGLVSGGTNLYFVKLMTVPTTQALVNGMMLETVPFFTRWSDQTIGWIAKIGSVLLAAGAYFSIGGVLNGMDTYLVKNTNYPEWFSYGIGLGFGGLGSVVFNGFAAVASFPAVIAGYLLGRALKRLSRYEVNRLLPHQKDIIIINFMEKMKEMLDRANAEDFVETMSQIQSGMPTLFDNAANLIFAEALGLPDAEETRAATAAANRYILPEHLVNLIHRLPVEDAAVTTFIDQQLIVPTAQDITPNLMWSSAVPLVFVIQELALLNTTGLAIPAYHLLDYLKLLVVPAAQILVNLPANYFTHSRFADVRAARTGLKIEEVGDAEQGPRRAPAAVNPAQSNGHTGERAPLLQHQGGDGATSQQTIIVTPADLLPAPAAANLGRQGFFSLNPTQRAAISFATRETTSSFFSQAGSYLLLRWFASFIFNPTELGATEYVPESQTMRTVISGVFVVGMMLAMLSNLRGAQGLNGKIIRRTPETEAPPALQAIAGLMPDVRDPSASNQAAGRMKGIGNTPQQHESPLRLGSK